MFNHNKAIEDMSEQELRDYRKNLAQHCATDPITGQQNLTLGEGAAAVGQTLGIGAGVGIGAMLTVAAIGLTGSLLFNPNKKVTESLKASIEKTIQGMPPVKVVIDNKEQVDAMNSLKNAIVSAVATRQNPKVTIDMEQSLQELTKLIPEEVIANMIAASLPQAQPPAEGSRTMTTTTTSTTTIPDNVPVEVHTGEVRSNEIRPGDTILGATVQESPEARAIRLKKAQKAQAKAEKAQAQELQEA